MELLLLLTYGAICFAVFRIFKVPVNGYTIVTAIMGGMVMIGVIILSMNFNHPYTVVARTYFVSTPIVPSVGGRVIEVPVVPGVPLAEGDVLFQIDPVPYQLKVNQLEARRAQVATDTSHDIDRVVAAEAGVDTAKSALSLAQVEFKRTRALAAEGVASAEELDVERNALELAKGNVKVAEAKLLASQQEQGVTTAGGDNAKLAEIMAELDTARWQLDETTVRAPSEGYVTQVGLRDGFYAVPFPLQPSMVFISERKREIVAAFRQIAAQRLAVGDDAEIAFFSVPGQVFGGKVSRVIDVMAAGEFSASGELIAPEDETVPGRITIVIELDEEVENYALPGGAGGYAAVYTDHWEMFALIRKILLRMNAWAFYFSMDH